jgi:hypothetical protein
MPDFADGAIKEKHFHDVKANFDGWMFEEFEVIECGLGEKPAFADVDGRSGPHPFLGGPGFDFDKNEAVRVAEDDVDFAAIGSEVGGEKFQAHGGEMAAGGLFAQGSVLEMKWEF